jgi:predicted amidohydrolase
MEYIMIVACGQMRAIPINDAPQVWPVVERLAEQAHAAGADMLLLPETTYPGYWLESAERYYRDDVERSAKVLSRFADLARQHQMWITAGFVEENDGRLFNSAAVIDRTGSVRSIARKNFLWDCDNRWFDAGESIKAFDTEFGRLGVLICADARAPEIAATLVADGAAMLLLPTAWVNVGQRGRTYRNVHPEFLIRARALEFGVPIACCSKFGQEGPTLEYVGRSRIVDANGDCLTEAPGDAETLLVGEMKPGRPRPPTVSPTDQACLRAVGVRHKSTQTISPVELATNLSLNQIESLLLQNNARFTEMETHNLETFIPARIAALEGAQVVLATGPLIDESLLRARAAENRIFVLVGAEHCEFVAAPDGTVLHSPAQPVERLNLRIHEADIKQFTPMTDLWSQRRAACYRLSPAPLSPKPQPSCV